MAVEDELVPVEGSTERLNALIAERVTGHFALFFVTHEGRMLPDWTYDESGHVIDQRGQVFAFWTGWDAARNTFTFESWERVEPEPFWQDIAEYREARASVGLRESSAG